MGRALTALLYKEASSHQEELGPHSLYILSLHDTPGLHHPDPGFFYKITSSSGRAPNHLEMENHHGGCTIS